MFHYPDFNPVAFSIGKLAVRWYGITYLVAFLVCWLGLRARANVPWSKVRPLNVDDVVFYGALGAIVGGRVGYMLVYAHQELFSDPLSLFTGCAGGIFFVRVGNFINGELWGKTTSPDAPWAVIVNGEARHASQLYEAFLEGLVLCTVLWLYTKKPRPLMACSGLFLLLYGAFRILVEFVRVPDEQMGYLALGWVTTGMLLSIPMVIAGATLLVLAQLRSSEGGAAARTAETARGPMPKKAG